MMKHVIIFVVTFIFGAFNLYGMLLLHNAYRPNAPLLSTYVQWFVFVAIFWACLYIMYYFIYYIVKWIKNKLFPDLSGYVEVASSNGHAAREIQYKLSKKGISVHIDDSKHPLPCRILVPADMRELAMEVLEGKHA